MDKRLNPCPCKVCKIPKDRLPGIVSVIYKQDFSAEERVILAEIARMYAG